MLQVVQQLVELESLLPDGALFRVLWLLRVQYGSSRAYGWHSRLRVMPHDVLLFLAMLHSAGDGSPEARVSVVRRLTSRTNNFDSQLQQYCNILQAFVSQPESM